MSKHSRDRGKRGELLLRDVLRGAGWPAAERGQQRAGGADSPDVRGGPAEIHFECKFTERLDVRAALDQATADAPTGKIPVVAHKRNRHPWVAVLPLDDLLRLVRELEFARMTR